MSNFIMTPLQLYEAVSISLNFFQNFGLVGLMAVPWPESFKNWIRFLDVFRLDIAPFAGECFGFWLTAFTGLLFPVWLLVMFEPTCATALEKSGLNLFELEGFLMLSSIPGFLMFLLALGFGITALAVGTAWHNDALNFSIAVFMSMRYIFGEAWNYVYVLAALFTYLASLYVIFLNYMLYLKRWKSRCNQAKEDFPKSRQRGEITIFIFSYSLIYLSGVSAAMSMAMKADLIASPETTHHHVACGLWDEVAHDSSTHKISCCSDTALPGWEQQAGCSVWSAGNSTSTSFSDAEDFCAKEGGRLCTTDEVKSKCSSATAQMSNSTKSLTVSGISCEMNAGLNGIYSPVTYTASGRPWYISKNGANLYFDPSCDGKNLYNEWIFDSADSPSVTAENNLDGTRGCDISGYTNAAGDLPPSGTSFWDMWCGDGDDFTLLSVTIEDGEEETFCGKVRAEEAHLRGDIDFR